MKFRFTVGLGLATALLACTSTGDGSGASDGDAGSGGGAGRIAGASGKAGSGPGGTTSAGGSASGGNAGTPNAGGASGGGGSSGSGGATNAAGSSGAGQAGGPPFVEGPLAGTVKITVDVGKTFQKIDGLGFTNHMLAAHDDVVYQQINTEAKPYAVDMEVTKIHTNVFAFEIPWVLEAFNDNDDPNVLDYDKLFTKQNPPGLKHLTPPYNYSGSGFPSYVKLLTAIRDKAASVGRDMWYMPKLASPPSFARVGGKSEGPIDLNRLPEIAEFAVAAITALKREVGIRPAALSLELRSKWWADTGLDDKTWPAVYKAIADRFARDGIDVPVIGPELFSYGNEAESVATRLNQWVKPWLADPDVSKRLDPLTLATGYFMDASAGNTPGWDGRVAAWTKLHDFVGDGRRLWQTTDMVMGPYQPPSTGSGRNLDFSCYHPDLGGAIEVASEMFIALKYGRVSLWNKWGIWWWSELEWVPHSLLTDDDHGGFKDNPRLYAAKQFYDFIDRGAVHVAADTSDPNLPAIAFTDAKNKRVTLVLINRGKQATTFSVTGARLPGTFAVTRTAAGENFADQGSVMRNAAIPAPAQSVLTLTGAWQP